MHLIRMYDMKYKEKVTYRTTASGGQEIITEQVPVYNKFEQFAKKQHDKRINKINGTKDGKPMKIPFILKHPGICALILGVFIILVVYLISSANTYMDELIKQYTSLTAKTNDSKYAFDKKLFYVTVEADGTKKITFGYKSEEQQEQAEEAADEAASTGTAPSSTPSSWNVNSTNIEQMVAAIQGADSSLRSAGICVAAATMTNTGDPILSAALLGNSNHEGTFGQWQDKNSSLQLSLGSYGTVYKRKTADAIGLTCSQLHSDLIKVAANNNPNKIGFGPTQATSSGNINTYVQIMESMNIQNSSDVVTKGMLEAMEISYCNTKFNTALKNTNTTHMNGMKYSVDDVYNSKSEFATYSQTLGEDTVRKIIQDTICVIANYERYGNYKTNVSEGAKRSLSACQGFSAMVKAGIVKGS